MRISSALTLDSGESALAFEPLIVRPTVRPIGFLARLRLMGLSTGMMVLAIAPAGQFYLAYVALVPWLLAVRSTKSALRAGLWGWLGFALVLVVNLLYLGQLRILAPPALATYLALGAGVCASLTHATALLRLTARTSALGCVARASGVAATWSAMEWCRGNIGCAIPWLYLGHSQTSVLSLCQIADVTGVYGISFCIVFVNVLIALTWISWRENGHMLGRAWIYAAAILTAVNAYGAFRLLQHSATHGPTVLSVQPNDRNHKDAVTVDRQRAMFATIMSATMEALHKREVDLVLWPESSMPALNPEAHQLLQGRPAGDFYIQVHRALLAFASAQNLALITGGRYADGHATADGKITIDDIRNSAYFYDRTGRQERYDKARLMPFGEVVPLRNVPLVHRFFLLLTPNTEQYILSSDPQKRLPVFNVVGAGGRSFRCVAPICWDDLDSLLIRDMIGDHGGKRADFIANVSNEAWFDFAEPIQHLAPSIFRCIENRVPAVRSVNGGISAFIDSCGRITQSIPMDSSGTAVGQIQIDDRVSFYTRFGDAFAAVCGVVTVGIAIVAVFGRFRAPRIGL